MMFKNVKKVDLITIANELGVKDVSENQTVADLKEKILNSECFEKDASFAESFIRSVIESRISEDEKTKQALELERLRLERVEREIELAKLQAEKTDTGAASSKTKLPDLPLPIFSGKYEDFKTFKETFDSLISKNKELSDAQKVHYLRASLKDKASNIQTTEDSYESLLQALEERYQNKRILVDTHIQNIMNYPKIMHESANDLQDLLDCINKNLRALKLLEYGRDKLSDILMLNVIVQKLDRESRKQYELSLSSTEVPKLDDLISFLLKRTHVLESITRNVSAVGKPMVKSVTPVSNHHRPKSLFVKNETSNCFACQSNSHSIYKCSRFKGMMIKDREELVKKHKLCFNCLHPSHSVSNCKSNSTCTVCKSRHHTLLHRYGSSSAAAAVVSSSGVSEHDQRQSSTNFTASLSQTSLLSNGTTKTVLLSTCVVYVRDFNNQMQPIVCILDSGSTVSFITAKCADALGIKKERIDVTVSGLEGSSYRIKSKVDATLSDSAGENVWNTQLLVVPKICHLVPSSLLNVADVKVPENIQLADPNFFKPKRIDLLLGNELFFEFIRAGKIRSEDNNQLVFQNTVFGFIVSGSLETRSSVAVEPRCYLSSNLNSLNDTLKSFWEIESVAERTAAKNKEQSLADEHFMKTHKRAPDGKFVVQMPFTGSLNQLGESKEDAVKSLNSLWNRLSKNPCLADLYRAFMKEYQDLGHMEEVKHTSEPEITYYLPHHPVYRPEKSSTKLRVVFNGSHKTSSGESLNSLQLNGGVIQDDIFSIMLRFRMHQYAFTADVRMMYRMIWIDECQRDLQRILWKEGPNEEIKIFRLCTVTYGFTSSPYLATRCLEQLAVDGKNNYPSASEVVLSSFYMDDVLTGASDLDSAKALQDELIALLASCGMQLHKWHSNHPDLVRPLGESAESYAFDKMSDTKVLGVLWNPESDNLSYNVSLSKNPSTTKRGILSNIASIFDPLGLIGPIITTAKVFLQKLWRLQTTWDQPLPKKIADEWLLFQESLKLVNAINCPRFVLENQATKVSLVGFSDASEVAYGATLYLVSSGSTERSTRLLCSKSRVAPLKTVTIPRLELCAAVLLVKLASRVLRALDLPMESAHFYTDSTIVLSWLRKSSSDLKTFVASRIAAIQELSDVNQWHHVSSHDNPADLVSRGVSPATLLSSSLWWYGPKFLFQDLRFPSGESDIEPSDRVAYSCELRSNKDGAVLLVTDEQTFFETIFSLSNDYDKIVRVVAYLYRFIFNSRQGNERRNGSLTLQEIREAEKRVLLAAQQPLRCSGKNSGNLVSLNPFTDRDGILRVGGRLENADLPFDHKYPVILPKGSKISEVIFNTYHRKNLHVGPQNLLNLVRAKFWPLGGRNLARKVVHSCITCFKVKPTLSSQIMGNLPIERITGTFAFNHVGVDLGGPFLVSYKNQRKGTLNKVYLCLFICFATKAVHLELLSDLTSQSLIATLKRFIARRGKCARLFTDNATNFVGANSDLKRLYKLVSFPDSNLAAFLTAEGIDWRYIPPRSPHFGGLWEAGIKSVKTHLKRIVGRQSTFTYEELETVIVQIEGILNSRPITPLSNDSDCYEALTPGHFLIGRAMKTIVEPELIDLSDNRLSRWQRTTKVVQNVWKKWRLDYLHTLQQRSKWSIDKDNLKVGSLILVKEDNVPCCKWPLGRIVETYAGKDSKVRVVKVKTAHGEYKRPVTKIAVLPMV